MYTEKNIKQKYFNRLRYENKPLENKERMLIITKVDPKNAVNELVSYFFNSYPIGISIFIFIYT